MFNSANNDFDQLQVKTADGNDGNAMLRLGCQTGFWLAFIGSGFRVQRFRVQRFGNLLPWFQVSGVRVHNLGIANLGIKSIILFSLFNSLIPKSLNS